MNTQTPPSFAVAGIGELLWDVFPHRMKLGGAPANFAWHCSQLGATSYPISRVGADALGFRMCRELDLRNVNTYYIDQDPSLPTGQAKVTIDSNGKPSYDIVKDVAWDNLTLTKSLKTLAARLDAACFGTLCQRSAASRRTIREILELMPVGSLKILDVNLRQAYHDRELLESSLQIANALKLSDEELPTLASYFELEGSVVEQLEQLRSRFDLRLLVYTRGADGSILLDESECDEHAGLPSDAFDSVGAGDSFTAAICMGALHQWPLHRINEFANKVASFVCTQPGATPELPLQFSLKNHPQFTSI